MRDQLAGKTVFVTGAAGLLGSTYVRRMLSAGARVLATDLEGAPLGSADVRIFG